MGYGFPAAIGAQLGNPGRRVIDIAGDGSIQMNIQELATAVARSLPVIVAILNNGYLGMVRQWQELFYGHRYSATCLERARGCRRAVRQPDGTARPYSPDFVKLAEAYGAVGMRVTRPEEVGRRCAEAGRSRTGRCFIDFQVEREANVWPMVPAGAGIHEMMNAAGGLEEGMTHVICLHGGEPARECSRGSPGLFSGRGYNLESITAGVTTDASVTRITLVCHGGRRVVAQIKKQLNKLIDVIKVTDLTGLPSVNRELALMKVQAPPGRSAGRSSRWRTCSRPRCWMSDTRPCCWRSPGSRRRSKTSRRCCALRDHRDRPQRADLDGSGDKSTPQNDGRKESDMDRMYDLRHHPARRGAVARRVDERGAEARDRLQLARLGVDVIEAGFPISSPHQFKACQAHRGGR